MWTRTLVCGSCCTPDRLPQAVLCHSLFAQESLERTQASSAEQQAPHRSRIRVGVALNLLTAILRFWPVKIVPEYSVVNRDCPRQSKLGAFCELDAGFIDPLAGVFSIAAGTWKTDSFVSTSLACLAARPPTQRSNAS